jgi:hypothetical protein
MRGHIGSRRSFICRIKLGPHQPPIDLSQSYSSTATGTAGQPNTGSPNSASNGIWSSGSRSARNRNTLHTNMEAAMLVNEKPLYSVLHITGYTKIWPPNPSVSNNMYQQNIEMDPQQQQLQNNNFHLIAIARIQMTSAPTDLVNSSNYEFVTRHDQNGNITFVDQRFV